MPAPPHVTVHEGTPCPDVGGSCSYVDTDDVFLEFGASRFERAHELGHQFDRQVLTDADRTSLMRAMRVRGPWDQGTGEGCGSTCPDELFADAYAACATGMSPAPRKRKDGIRVQTWTTAYGYYPTARQHRRVCFTIQFLGWYRTYQSSAESQDVR